MTLLSNEKEDDSLMRISNPAIAEELLEFAVLQIRRSLTAELKWLFPKWK
jgi:hypothetical protein